MRKLQFQHRTNPAKLYDEVNASDAALAGQIVSMQGWEDGQLEIEVDDDLSASDQAALGKLVEAHDPTPPPPAATPVEELNAGIQAAQGMADIKAVFADWSEKYRDRL